MMTSGQLKSQTIRYGIELLAMTGLFVAGTSLNTLGSHIFWILMPCVAVLLPVMYGWMALWELGKFARRVEREATGGAENQESAGSGKRSAGNQETTGGREHGQHLNLAGYDRAIRRPFRCSLAAAILSGWTFLAELVLVIRCLGVEGMGADCIFLAVCGCQTAVCVLSFLGSRKRKAAVTEV